MGSTHRQAFGGREISDQITEERCYRPATFRNYFTRAEAPKFGYTTRYWTPSVLEGVDNCIRFLGYPVK